MSLPHPVGAETPEVEWVGELTLDYNGEPAARLSSPDGRPTVQVFNLAAFKSLGAILSESRARPHPDLLPSLAAALPVRVDLNLHGVSIGHFAPREPQNWEAKLAGLPFGRLALDKLAVLKASLKGS